MNFGRILANAVARRIAFVIVAGALAWLGLDAAKAQDFSQCSSPTATNALCPDLPTARTAADASAQYYCNQQAECNGTDDRQETWTGTFWQVRTRYRYGAANNGAWGNYKRSTAECSAGQVYNSYSQQCQQSCAGRPSTVQPFLPLSGSKQCFNGCVVSYMQNGDDETSTRSYSGAMCSNEQFKQECGAGFVWNSYMGVCQPIQPDCPEGQVEQGGQCRPENSCPDGMVSVSPSTPGAIAQGALHCKPAENECPPGNVKSPSGQCLPGEGQCAAGEARRADGTCGKDSDGDGTADDDDDNPDNDSEKESFSGGDSCASPPSCAGGPIMCGQARIQWRIDCNTRKNVNVSGGSCTQVPLCTGDKCNAMEYASLLQQWRTTCAVEKMAKNQGESADGQPDWTKVTGTGTEGQGEEPEKPHQTRSLGLGMLDDGGFLGGGSCPSFGSVDLGIFGSVDLDGYDWICDFLAAVRVVMIGLGGFIAFGIVAGRGVV
ncbi:hypothetical protein [Pseudoxanthomonas sp. SE1]|uniref:hypothetical protein n=1 Tax=Pseudoxanthomonas sp. SE1 TaxID=1664560 RepID=UPI00240D60D0|nr:hypothetical protein [Pseudoxanthomonas sp. SE1]WFC43770.1 hypothetical protein OY559_09865 [Pseudoxanthomonas sp. SE1]